MLLSGGRVAGVWEIDGERLAIALFAEEGPVDDDQLELERERLVARIGRELRLSVTTI